MSNKLVCVQQYIQFEKFGYLILYFHLPGTAVEFTTCFTNRLDSRLLSWYNENFLVCGVFSLKLVSFYLWLLSLYLSAGRLGDP